MQKLKCLWYKFLIFLRIKKVLSANEMKEQLLFFHELNQVINNEKISELLNKAQEEFIAQRFKSKNPTV